jgi:hypothetical protein
MRGLFRLRMELRLVVIALTVRVHVWAVAVLYETTK